jgi:two-component system NtrC family sensor kinase
LHRSAHQRYDAALLVTTRRDYRPSPAVTAASSRASKFLAILACRTTRRTCDLENLRLLARRPYPPAASCSRRLNGKKLASLGQLTAGIAHEIKNPLNFVNNFSALSEELTDELNEVLRPAAFDEKTRVEVDELTKMPKDMER